MRRRGFLRFLGVGMAAASLSPGQLIAAVSRPLLVSVNVTLPMSSLIRSGDGLTLAKLLKAKRILDAQNVPWNNRWIANADFLAPRRVPYA